MAFQRLDARSLAELLPDHTLLVVTLAGRPGCVNANSNVAHQFLPLGTAISQYLSRSVVSQAVDLFTVGSLFMTIKIRYTYSV